MFVFSVVYNNMIILFINNSVHYLYTVKIQQFVYSRVNNFQIEYSFFLLISQNKFTFTFCQHVKTRNLISKIISTIFG